MEPTVRTSEQAPAPATSPFAVAIQEYSDRLALLSARELAVVSLAAEGYTDERIAQRLDLSVSTVNSYWVRVRGKLGQFNRTEIVAELLRHKARVENAALLAENARLAQRLREETERTRDLLTALNALREDPWPLSALAYLPQAALVTRPPAVVAYANVAARSLYRAPLEDLEGLPMRELTAAATPESLREPCRDLFAEGGPEEERIGLAEPYYARRRDGSNFRATVVARRFDSRSGPLAVVTVREFLEDIDVIVEALRQPPSGV